MFSTFAAQGHRLLYVLALTLAAPACGALSDKPRSVHQVHFTAEGNLVISADGFVSVFDSELDKKILSYELDQDRYILVDVARQGNVAAMALHNSVIVFDTLKAKRTLKLGAAQLAVSPKSRDLILVSLSVSPDGQYLAVTSVEAGQYMPPAAPTPSVHYLSVFRTGTGERLWQRLVSSPSDPQPPGSVQTTTFANPLFSSDSLRLWVRIYNWGTDATEISELVAAETGAPEKVLSLPGAQSSTFELSHDHTLVLGWMGEGYPSQFPAVWNATDGAFIQAFPGLAGAECGSNSRGNNGGGRMAASGDGRLFAAVFFGSCAKNESGYQFFDGNVVIVWNLQGEVLHKISLEQASGLAFSPDGSKLAIAEYENGVSVYRMSDGMRTASRSFDKQLF